MDTIKLNDGVVKYACLISLIVQNVFSILLLRYVRTTPGPRFINSTAVFVSEVQKLLISLFLFLYTEKNVRQGLKIVYEKMICQQKDSLKIGVLALFYTLQNNLLFIAISNLDAATFQVSFQLKIFTTAFFMVLILNRQLNLSQWFALFLLFLGVSFVQIEDISAVNQKADVNPLQGIIAVVCACLLSGLSGVYFEKILKDNDASIWLRNIQMGFFGSIFALITICLTDGTKVKNDGLFYAYTPMVWIAIFVQSAGGLLVALVVKYADNILKGFATSLAIIISCVLSIIFFDFHLTSLFVLGSSMVITSVLLYSKPDLIFNVPILKEILRDRSIVLDRK